MLQHSAFLKTRPRPHQGVYILFYLIFKTGWRTSSLRRDSGESPLGSALTRHQPHLQPHFSTNQASLTSILVQDQKGQQFLVQ